MPCKCNLGGSQSVRCDQLTGECKCWPPITGRHCDQLANYYIPRLDNISIEAEFMESETPVPALLRVETVDSRAFPNDVGQIPGPYGPFYWKRSKFWSGLGFLLINASKIPEKEKVNWKSKPMKLSVTANNNLRYIPIVRNLVRVFSYRYLV